VGCRIPHLISPPFKKRPKPYTRTYHTSVTALNDQDVLAEFPLVSLRVYLEKELLSETSDIDRLIWGKQRIYPIEIVHEITDVTTRHHAGWWAIEFSDVAKHASWVFRGGGATMHGARSAVFRIPFDAFRPLDAGFLNGL
jgi:hypothetical protein